MKKMLVVAAASILSACPVAAQDQPLTCESLVAKVREHREAMVRELGEAFDVNLFADWEPGIEEFHTSHPLEEHVEIVLLCTKDDLFTGLNSSIELERYSGSLSRADLLAAAQAPVEMVAFALLGAPYGEYEILHEIADTMQFSAYPERAMPGREPVFVEDHITENYTAKVYFGYIGNIYSPPDITYYVEYKPAQE